MKVLISVSVFLLPFLCGAQTQFQRAIGGTGLDYAYSIKRTTDGGYVAAGGTTSFGAGDFYIVKLDGSGNLQWTRTVGGIGYDGAFFIVQTTDGGYAAAGQTSSFGAGAADFYIVKLDAGGNLQWSRTVGGPNDDVALAIVQTMDGGYAVAGYTYSFGAGNRDYYIVKLDAGGNLQWSRTVGGTNYDYAESIIQTTDGGYAVAGWTVSFGEVSGDFYIVKLDAAGNLQWSRTVGGNQDDYCLSIIQTTDGGYAAAGPTSSYGAGNNDFYIVKLDGSGALQWTRTVGGTGLDYAESIIQTTDGGYAVGGLTYSFGAGNEDMYLVKLDSSGMLQWSRTVGGPNDDYAESIVQTTDGGYIGAGHTNSYGAGNFDAYIVKFDASGNTCGNSTSPPSISGSGGTIGSPTSTVTSPTPTITSPSSTTNTVGTITTICTFVGIQSISNEIPASCELYQNYPNPFNPTTKIRFDIPSNVRRETSNVKIIIYDVLGREVSSLVDEQLKSGTYEIDWDASDYPSSVYYYKLVAGDYTKTKKMILLK